MRIKPLFLLLFLSLPLTIFAQSYAVSGTVKDGKNMAVPYANVFLLNISDTTIVKGASTNEKGFFVIENTLPNTYFIRASYIGQTSRLTPIDIQKDVAMGTIIIEEKTNTLGEVVLVSKKPTVERKADRIVFNVENTVVSQSNSWDILRKTPGVIMLQDELYIRNQVSTVYLNDRKIQLTVNELKGLLEGFSGANVKSIEVIPNPPSKYDAEGGPILNIITSKNITPGYKGNINGNFTEAIFPKYDFGTSHYFKGKKLNFYANYSIKPRKELKKDESHINFMDATNTVFSQWDNDFERTSRSLAQNASTIIDYNIDERNSLNLTANFAISPNREYKTMIKSQMSNAQNQLDSVSETQSQIERNTRNLASDLTYSHKLKKSGASLAFNTHYTHYEEDRQQLASSDYTMPSGTFIRNFSFATEAMQHTDIFTGQIDYTTPLGSFIFENGAKYSYIESKSALDYFSVNGLTLIPDPALSDDFNYNESVAAAYVSILGNWEKWSLKMGLRGEQTSAKGTSVTLNSTNNQDYFKLFPTFYALYVPTENHSFSLDYSRKLRRPRYQDLNPFKYFLNENNYNVGNPNLRPSFSHNFNFNYTLKGEYFFDVYYRDNGSFISTLSFQDNQNQTIQQLKQNVIESTSYGFDFTYSKSLNKFWFVYLYTSIFSESETFLAVESNNVQATNTVDGFYGSLSNYLTLSKNGTFTGEASLTYLSNFILGSYKVGPTTNLTLGLRKSLWNKRAVLSLTAEDILGKANARNVSKYLNQDNSYFPMLETQFVRFGFTYNFGNFRLSDNNREIDKIERDRLNAQ